MTERLNNYQIAAKLRAEKRRVLDPNFYKRHGAIGGKAQVKKGFATLSKEDLKEVSKKGGKASPKRDDLRGKDYVE